MNTCHDFTCGNVRPGEPFDPARDCPKCWAAMHAESVAASLGRKAVPVHTPRPDPEPLRVVRLDGANLAGGPARSHADGHSNASILRHDGWLLLAYRHRNKGGLVWVTTLDPDTYQPHGPGERLDLTHHHGKYGQEDPRLFTYRESAWVIYAAVEGKTGPTSQCVARLTKYSRQAQTPVYLDLPGRKEWEKNWTPFEHAGRLYAVYGVKPHVVVEIDPASGRCRRAFETPTPHAWSGGHLRGGAPPVRVGDEFLCWFHGRLDAGFDKPTYTVGVYSFEAKPPFRVTRMTPTPVMYGDSRTRPPAWYVNNWFPCGAFLDGQTWVVSAGVHDQWIDVAEFDAADVCKRLLTPAGVKAKNGCGCAK